MMNSDEKRIDYELNSVRSKSPSGKESENLQARTTQKRIQARFKRKQPFAKQKKKKTSAVALQLSEKTPKPHSSQTRRKYGLVITFQ